jgi:hypothetical protein
MRHGLRNREAGIVHPEPNVLQCRSDVGIQVYPLGSDRFLRTPLIMRQHHLHCWRQRYEAQHQPRELLTILLHPGAMDHHIIQDGREALLRERLGQQALMTDVGMNLSSPFFEGVFPWPDRSRDNALLQAIAFNVDATRILSRQRTRRGGFAGTRDAINEPNIHHVGSHTRVGLTPGTNHYTHLEGGPAETRRPQLRGVETERVACQPNPARHSTWFRCVACFAVSHNVDILHWRARLTLRSAVPLCRVRLHRIVRACPPSYPKTSLD